MKNATLTELDRQNKKLHHIDGKMTEVRGNDSLRTSGGGLGWSHGANQSRARACRM